MSEASEQTVNKTTLKDSIQISWSRSDQYRIDLMRKNVSGDVYHAKTVAKDFCVANSEVTLNSLSEKVDKLQEKYDVCSSNIGVINCTTKVIVDNNKKLDERVSGIEARLDEQESNMKEFEDETRENWDEYNRRCERQDETWNRNNERLDKNDERLDEMEKSAKDALMRMEESMGRLEERIEKGAEENKERYNEIDRRVAQLESDRERMEKIEYVLENLMTTMEKKNESIDEKIALMESRMKEMLDGVIQSLTGTTSSLIYDAKEELNKKISDLQIYTDNDIRAIKSTVQSLDEHKDLRIDGAFDKIENWKNEIDVINQKMTLAEVENAKQTETMQTVVLPSIRGLAVDVKDLKEAYNSDLIRVERDSTNRFDTMAADLIHKIDMVKSDALGNMTDLNDLKSVVENISSELKEIQTCFQKDTVVICCD